MFMMDVPYVPASEALVVLAQAAAPGATQTLDYILQQCQETESTGNPRSAMRGVDPAGWLAVYLGNRDHRDIYGDRAAMASITTTMLEGTKHGKIFAEVDNEGLTSYHYDPTPGYVGKDRAVFISEFNGKRYKIVIDLVVSLVVNENEPVCPPPKLIKVNGKPVSDSSPYLLNSFTITFADLPGSAAGQTTGSEITLDLTAAGNGWFIDSKPGDNSEFLPTSNPNV